MAGTQDASPKKRNPNSQAAEGNLDQDLVAIASAKSILAFSNLYDELSPMVYGLALRVIRNPALTEEVTQEVFLEIWNNATGFKPEKGSAKSWIATMTHRRAVDRVRSEQSARNREKVTDEVEPDWFELAAESSEDAKNLSRIERALSQISPAQREAISLAYYGGHTYQQVASMLDTPTGTIKTRIRDGMKQIKQILEPAQ